MAKPNFDLITDQKLQPRMNTHAAARCCVINGFGLGVLVGELDRGLDFLPGYGMHLYPAS